MNITAKNGDGTDIVLEPLVEGMMRILVKSQVKICATSEGCVELHYVSETRKIVGKLKSHVGLEKFAP